MSRLTEKIIAMAEEMVKKEQEGGMIDAVEVNKLLLQMVVVANQLIEQALESAKWSNGLVERTFTCCEKLMARNEDLTLALCQNVEDP